MKLINIDDHRKITLDNGDVISVTEATKGFENIDKPIDSFSGCNFWLSNFWLTDVVFEGFVYTSTETAYQAAKSLDHDTRKNFLNISPSKAKRLGNAINLREDWEKVKVNVMRKVIKQKFMTGSFLAEKLIQTGNKELIEGNNWNDVFWGVCNGVGKNKLGILLMERRGELNDG